MNKYFIQEEENGGPILPPSKATDRTAMATKTSVRTVRRICSVFNRSFRKDAVPLKPTFSSPKERIRPEPVTNFTDYDKSVLRRTILGFYERKEAPTLYKIREELSEKIGYYGCESSLRKVMLKIGFKYEKIDDRKILLERNDVTAARTRFLKEMRQPKQSGRTFVYLGETRLNQNCILEKPCPDTSSQEERVLPATGKTTQLIILHAGTKYGFISNGELICQAKRIA